MLVMFLSLQGDSIAKCLRGNKYQRTPTAHDAPASREHIMYVPNNLLLLWDKAPGMRVE
jgi:hypothetical protein